MNFLLEIGVEELPAASVLPAVEFVKSELGNFFKERQIPFGEIKIFATPRRLTVLVEKLAESEPLKRETVFGPPKNIAFDKDGNPTKALLGFLKKNGASLEEVKVLKKGKGEYVAVEKTVGGRKTEELLAELIPQILDRIPFPKRMRWDSSGKTFLRPVRWILALADGRVVKFKWGNLESSNTTYGHRFKDADTFRGRRLEITDPVDYFKKLDEFFVQLDHRERRKKIEKTLSVYEGEFDAEVPKREELVEENTFLTEYVYPVLGTFSERYLELPPLVIITVAAHHQRFFCFRKEDGTVVPKFLAISNNVPKDDSKVREGYENVLRARLEDALFFYREDLKTPLEKLVPKLRGILQHPKLGTLYDKTLRLEKLTPEIEKAINPQKVEKAKRAAYLSKADLLTEMVKELDELQGYMGYIYAKAHGEDEEVALALWEQYRPKGQDDTLPETEVGTALSIADKLHDLIGYFGIGERPKSTADPLGLRRAALGIIRTVGEKGLNPDLKGLVEFTYELFENLETPKEELIKDLDEFFKQRTVNYLSERYPKELVLAVVQTRSGFDVAETFKVVKELNKLLSREELSLAREAYRRVRKIISKIEEEYGLDENLLSLPEERELYAALSELEKLIETLGVEQKVQKLAEFKKVIDRFFDNVMVMDKDEKVRQNRIALLQRAKKLFEQVADLEKLPLKD